MINKGVLLAAGTLEELRRAVSPRIRVRIKASNISPEITSCITLGGPSKPDAAPGKSWLETETGETSREAEGRETWLEAEVGSEKEIPELVRRIVSAGGEIYHVSACLPSLEDIYFSLTSGKEARR